MVLEFRRLGALAIAAALPVLLASCNATSSEGPTRVSATPGVDRSAVYPEITGSKPAAASQMSDEEAVAFSARMNALAGSRRSGAISEAEYRRRLAELQALGEGHGQATLAEIERQN